MNNISFNGLYRLQTVSNRKDDDETLKEKLKEAFLEKNIESAVSAGSRSAEKEIFLTDTFIISYGTPEQDYEVFNEVFGKNLGYMKTLNSAKERFTREFMETFKSAVQNCFDKDMKALDTYIQDEQIRKEMKTSKLHNKDSYGFYTSEFQNKAMDIYVRRAK